MIGKLLAAIDRTVEFALFAIFLTFTVVGGLQVFNRFALGMPLSWSEEFQKFGHIWMVLLAIPVAYRHGAHLGMDIIHRYLPRHLQWATALLIELLWLVMAVAMGWFTLALMQVARFQESPGLGLRMDWVYSGIVIGSVYLALVALRRLAGHLGWHEPEPACTPPR